MRPRFFASFVLGLAALTLLGIASTAKAQGNVTMTSVKVSWTTPGDDSLTGTASVFDLRYATSPITAANFISATRFLGTPTPAAPGTRQSTIVTGLSANTTYYFAIKTGDDVPNWSLMSNPISATTLAAPDSIRPAPITLSVASVTDTSVALNWVATGDDSLSGTATSYDLRYSTAPITAANFTSATQATGEPNPQTSGTPQSFSVHGLARETTYYFAIKAADEAGNASAISNALSTSTSDTVPPARVIDLAVGFLWINWHGNFAVARAHSGLAHATPLTSLGHGVAR